MMDHPMFNYKQLSTKFDRLDRPDLLPLYNFAILSHNLHPELRGPNMPEEIMAYRRTLADTITKMKGRKAWELLKELITGPYRDCILAIMSYLKMDSSFCLPAGAVNQSSLTHVATLPKNASALCVFSTFLQSLDQVDSVARDYEWSELEIECVKFILGNREWIRKRLGPSPQDLNVAIADCIQVYYAGKNLTRLSFRGYSVCQLLVSAGYTAVCAEFANMVSSHSIPKPPVLTISEIGAKRPKYKDHDYRRIAILKNSVLMNWIHALRAPDEDDDDSVDESSFYSDDSDDDEPDVFVWPIVVSTRPSSRTSTSSTSAQNTSKTDWIAANIPTTVLECLEEDDEGCVMTI